MNPYAITGPALISFSGGRTSAYMLHQIMRAHDGTLPGNVHVAFANTGKEREETLRFVHECGERWGVRVHWLEWREGGFDEVGYNSASRSGEPFAALIRKKGYLPNAVTRFCTIELKVRTMTRFMRSLGYDRWSNVVGLRHDEGHRCMKAYARNMSNKEPFKTVLPLDKDRVTRGDVEAFWRAQSFNLGLRPYEGNCDLCFLKARGKLERCIRDGVDPQWWITQEATIGASRPSGARFVTERAYSDLAYRVGNEPLLIDDDLSEEHDAECGLLCGLNEEAA